MFSSVWRSLFPSRCLICSGGELVVDGVCAPCRSQIRAVPTPVCDICGRPLGTAGICLECSRNPPHYDRMLSACRYEGLARDIILRFKYHRDTVFKKFLAGLIYKRVEQAGILPEVLTCVPLHWTRMMGRGYNQSALIASELSGLMGVVMSCRILKKKRRTLSQAGLSRVKRVRNLDDVFTAGRVQGRSVMVVDDVVTTGQTAREVSRALKDAGARHVYFVSVGRTVA